MADAWGRRNRDGEFPVRCRTRDSDRAAAALGLYIAYNTAATAASVPAGRLGDRLGAGGPVRVLMLGVGLFAVAYTCLAVTGASMLMLAASFVAAGLAIGCVETAEHAVVATLAPTDLRGSAFGLLAAVQSVGNLAACAIAGVLWTVVSPKAASPSRPAGLSSSSPRW